MRRTGCLEGKRMERMSIARADRQIIMRIQNMYLSYGGLLQFLLAPVGARPAGDEESISRDWLNLMTIWSPSGDTY